MTSNTVSQYDIVLHIGLPKTGSSAIQKFCLDHQTWLAKQGLLYPHHGTDKNGVSGGHDQLYRHIHNNETDLAQKYIEEHLKKAQKKEQTLLLSSEGMHMYADRIHQLLSPYRVLVVAFFRHPFDALFSAFNQMVKRHFVKQALDDYVAKSTKHDKPILEGKTLFEYKMLFGDALKVLPYQSQLTGKGSVLHEVFSLLGLDHKYLASNNKSEKVNSGYCSAALEFKRLLNNVLSEEDKKLNFKIDLELQALSDGGSFSPNPLQDSLSAKAIEQLKQKFEPSVEKINQSFGITLANNTSKKSEFSSLNMLSEMISIVEFFKRERSSLYKILRSKVVNNEWSNADPDQIKLSELFDHTIEYEQKTKQDFYHPNVIRGMIGFSDVDFFRENAKLFWHRGDIETAYKLIEKALELRKGPTIKKLHEQIKSDYLKLQ
jgi:hypothetical protein